MIILLAWRNIWRNRTRSVVVMSAIGVGLLAGVFASSFTNGLIKQRIDNVIQKEISHIQFHHKDFRKENTSVFTLKNTASILAKLKTNKEVKATTSRVISNVMMASAHHTNGIRAIGIEPEEEKALTNLYKDLVEGAYFEGMKRNPILVSKRVAEKYKLKLRSKLILTLQDNQSEMVSGNFRVVGIFDSHNGMYDKTNVFVRKSDLTSLIGLEKDETHEVAVLLHHNEPAESLAKTYHAEYPDLEVLPWMDLGAGMRYMIEMMGLMTYILVGIIMIALVFSIINTMLMAVLDRTREIGMLMAIGMGRVKIFTMIVLESIMLSFVGGPLGLLVSWLLVTYFGNIGIDLGSGGESYEEVGFSSIVYPYLSLDIYFNITLMVLIMGVIAALYPAIKALRLNPVEAIRKI